MVTRTWEEREQRLLEAIATAEEEGREARADELDSPTGLSPQQVQQGLRALYDAGYVDGIDVTAQGDTFDLLNIRLLERGRRAVGQWPSEDQYARHGPECLGSIDRWAADVTDFTANSELSRRVVMSRGPATR